MGSAQKKSDTKKAPAKKPAEAPEIRFADPSEEAAFNQGMAARHAAIAKDDAPHGEGPLLKQWLKGWNHADNG